jgi:hypothetical protein
MSSKTARYIVDRWIKCKDWMRFEESYQFRLNWMWLQPSNFEIITCSHRPSTVNAVKKRAISRRKTGSRKSHSLPLWTTPRSILFIYRLIIFVLPLALIDWLRSVKQMFCADRTVLIGFFQGVRRPCNVYSGVEMVRMNSIRVMNIIAIF